MIEEKRFDYNNYLVNRLREIDDLEERKEAKEILTKGFEKLFSSSEKRYQELEQRLWDELEMNVSNYGIITTIVSMDQYDPINESLFPLCPEDVSKSKENLVRTVYLAAGDEICTDFLQSGSIIGNNHDSSVEVKFRIQKSKRYMEAIEKLCQLFLLNKISWNTIHMGYLERFYDLIPISENVSDELLKDITIKWDMWEPYVRCDMLPLWNVKIAQYNSHTFLMPCINDSYYEHSIVPRGNEDSGYLVDTHNDIREIRYEKNKIIMKSKMEVLDKINIYEILGGECKLSPGYNYALLSNHKQDSFTARFLNKNGVFLQTRTELIRKIISLVNEDIIKVVDIRIVDKITSPVLHANMNTFLKEEIFPKEQRKIILFCFKKTEKRDYLYSSHIRYILSQMQLEYFEYKCVGELV